MPTIYGYARFRTNETKQEIEQLLLVLKERGATEVFYEYDIGIKHNRPELIKLFSTIEEGDTLIATEVSRIASSLKQLYKITEIAKEKKLRLIIGKFVIDCTEQIDHMTEAMLQMLGVFTHLEKDMKIERTKSGLANAKAKGVILGRPRRTAKELPEKVLEYWPMYKSGILSKTDYAKLCNVSRPTLYKYIRLLSDL